MQTKQLYFFVICIAITTLMTHSCIAMEKDADTSTNFEKLETAFANIMEDIQSHLKDNIQVPDDMYKRCLVIDLTIKRCLRDGTSSCWNGVLVTLQEGWINKIRSERFQKWYDGPSPD